MIETQYYLKVCWLKANHKKAVRILDSLRDRVAAQGIALEKQLPVALMPLMMNAREMQLIKHTSEVLYRAIQKTILAGFSSPQIRSYLGQEELPREWIESDPGYPAPALVTRLDVLFDGETLKYIEFNADNPGMRGMTDILYAAVAEHPYYKDLLIHHHPPKVMESLLEAIKSAYRQFQSQDRNPTVALIDYENSSTEFDARLEADFFQRNGLKAILADPRTFQIKNNAAYLGETKIDAVRRCMKSQEFLKHIDQLKPFIQGYLQRAFCMINSFRAVYGSEKSVLALMSRPEFQHIYDEEEISVIKRHIPWTRRFSDRETGAPGGKTVELAKFLKKYRERMVVKPTSGYGGKDVFLGIDMPQADWEKLVDERTGNQEWIAQEYVPVPQLPAPFIAEDKVVVRKKYFNLNLFVVNGSFAGMLGRYSDSRVVNLQRGGAAFPVLRY